MKEFLLKLGFVHDNEAESSLIFDIWQILGGDEKSLVTLNNVRIFLLAVMGSYVEPSIYKDEQQLHKLGEDYIGSFNENGDLFLEISDIPIL